MPSARTGFVVTYANYLKGTSFPLLYDLRCIRIQLPSTFVGAIRLYLAAGSGWWAAWGVGWWSQN